MLIESSGLFLIAKQECYRHVGVSCRSDKIDMDSQKLTHTATTLFHYHACHHHHKIVVTLCPQTTATLQAMPCSRWWRRAAALGHATSSACSVTRASSRNGSSFTPRSS